LVATTAGGGGVGGVHRDSFVVRFHQYMRPVL
jgi:hypothetical protein